MTVFTIESNKMIHSSQEDTLSITDLTNVKWNRLSEKFCSSGKISYEQKVTDEEITSISKLIFGEKGIVVEVLNILDKGYKIYIKDNGMGVRRLWIEQYDSSGKQISYIAVRALNAFQAIKIGAEIFHQTLEQNMPYDGEKWFGAAGPYINHMTGEKANTRLDSFFSNNGVTLLLQKTNDGRYQMIFERATFELTEAGKAKRDALPPENFSYRLNKMKFGITNKLVFLLTKSS